MSADEDREQTADETKATIAAPPDAKPLGEVTVDFSVLTQRSAPEPQCDPSQTAMQPGREQDRDGGASVTAGPSLTLKSVYGEGGVGRVWLANQGELHRDVALKELKSSRADSPDAIRGFLKEAQITAQLEHPHIVPVYHLGFDPRTGRPFYTMRLVRGETFEDAIVQFHRLPRRSAAARREQRRLLNVQVAVCNAIAFAHSRGVIHRDLKPRNVVLGDFGEVIVLDWGMAKLQHGDPDSPAAESHAAATGKRQGASPPVAPATPASVSVTEDAAQTMEGQIKGTVAYMAPEQARGDNAAIDARTDVYGLGAMLFELLAGRPPHRCEQPGMHVLRLLQQIRDEPTPRTRSVQPAVPKPLDAICAKAMAYWPGERYANAMALAHDLENWLADEPVTAYPDSWPMRAARWARRNRTWVGVGAALVITALIALAISTILIRREQQETAAAYRQAAANFARAEANFQRARAAVDEMLAQIAPDRLDKETPAIEDVQRELLNKALAFYAMFLQEKPREADLQLEVAKAHFRVGEISQMLGREAEAEAGYRGALDLLAVLLKSPKLPPSLTEPARRQQAATHNKLGELLRKTDRIDVALEQYEAAAGLLAELRQAAPQDGTLIDESARVSSNRGLALQAAGRIDEAETAFRRAIELVQPSADRSDADQGTRQYLARALINLGIACKDQQRRDDAEAAYRRAIDLLEKLVAESPRTQQYQIELIAAVTNLGNLLMADASRREQARAEFERSAQLAGDLVTRFPRVLQYRREWANALNSLGGLHFGDREDGLAKDHWQQAAEVFRQLSSEAPRVADYRSLYGACLANLARVATRENDHAAAQRLLESAVAEQQAAFDANPANPAFRGFLRDHLWLLAQAQLRTGDVQGVTRSAARLPEIFPDGWEEYHRAAGFFSRASIAAAAPDGLTEEERQSLPAEYRAQAISLMRQAVEHGFADWANKFDAQPAFDAIRDDPEIPRLKPRP